MANLLGDSQLLLKDGCLASPAAALDGKEYVLLYFSAHWCPPCRQFTPKLAEWYKNKGADRNFEVVFVSSDRDPDSYQEYFSEMPWVALPFQDPLIPQLKQKFAVEGIPCLMVFSADGTLVQSKAVRYFRRNPEEFPWPPAYPDDAPLRSVIESAANIVDRNGNSFPVSEMRNRRVWGLYFSASWCGPCHMFMPRLRAWYETVKAKYPDFEILYVTWDEAEDNFRKFFAEHPWKALPFSDPKMSGIKDWLGDKLKVGGIPNLVLLDQDANVITTDGVSVVEGDPTAARYPWPPSPWVSLPEAAYTLDEHVWLVGFADAVDETKVPDLPARVNELIAGVALPYFVDNKPSDKIRFAYASKGPDVTRRIRAAFGLAALSKVLSPENMALFVILDIASGVKAVWPQASGLPSPAALADWVKAFLNGDAPVVPLTESIDPAEIERKRVELEAFKSWPASVTVDTHPHPLLKHVSVYRGQYGCDMCGTGGSGFVYHCGECGFDAHPKCAGIADASAPKQDD